MAKARPSRPRPLTLRPYPRRLALRKKAICQKVGKWLRIEIKHIAARWGVGAGN
ncbi:hypothetical protein N507_2812 [Lacticaseibacillus rhamnosus DSM 14870]|nr:hypothetical protein N507_2812 [Lacticaseibacillus rhamnosus DSM 14870]EDY98858.1 hypothetical protein LRH_04443 [Lacticaseibacillus rhamnosus HN001]CAR86953.1 Putative protein without homology [Lacticaseibacillus rhamnosus GG]